MNRKGETPVSFTGALFVALAAIAFHAWMLMLIGGALAIEAGWRPAAINYKTAGLCVLGLSVIGGALGVSFKSRDADR